MLSGEHSVRLCIPLVLIICIHSDKSSSTDSSSSVNSRGLVVSVLPRFFFTKHGGGDYSLDKKNTNELHTSDCETSKHNVRVKVKFRDGNYKEVGLGGKVIRDSAVLILTVFLITAGDRVRL